MQLDGCMIIALCRAASSCSHRSLYRYRTKVCNWPRGPNRDPLGPKWAPEGPVGPNWAREDPKRSQEGPVGQKWDLSGGIPHCVPSRVVCPQRICMPSRDSYALKGLVCPQGICMPSRDLYALKGLGPHGPGQWGPSPLRAYKSLEGIQIP